jgi:3alpha(or 20beta)-hydroxysteroid dehydrogenase
MLKECFSLPPSSKQPLANQLELTENNVAVIQGKVVIVTGGSSGMGKSHCQILAAGGAKVIVGDIADEPGRAVADAIGAHARFVHLDVTDGASWSNAVAETEEAFGPVTALVNNAGIGYPVPFDELTEQEFRKFVDINQIGVFLGMQAAVPSMRRRTAGGAAIINISSSAGLRAAPNALAYVASKFAVTGMTKAAALDLGPEGIRVNSIHPGVIGGTGMAAANEEYLKTFLPKIPLRQLGQLRHVSGLVEYLVSDDSGYCTGGEFVVDGGLICYH